MLYLDEKGLDVLADACGAWRDRLQLIGPIPVMRGLFRRHQLSHSTFFRSSLYLRVTNPTVHGAAVVIKHFMIQLGPCSQRFGIP